MQRLIRSTIVPALPLSSAPSSVSNKLTIGRIDVGRKDVSICGFGRRLRRFDRDVGRLVHFVIDLFAQRFELLRDDAMPSVIRNSAYVLIGSIAASASRSSSGR